MRTSKHPSLWPLDLLLRELVQKFFIFWPNFLSNSLGRRSRGQRLRCFEVPMDSPGAGPLADLDSNLATAFQSTASFAHQSLSHPLCMLAVASKVHFHLPLKWCSQWSGALSFLLC